MIVLAVNKPRGIVCTEERRERDSIVRFLNYPVRITYVGRLDKDSEGLLLMTNNGDIINRMMRAANKHEKEYKVTVDKEITEQFIKKMSEGVPILDTVTRPCTVKKIGKYTFSIILTQGLNRQIRRMCEALGYEVKDLLRVRVMNITLDGLKDGQYRKLTDQELDELYDQLKDSSALPGGKYQEQLGPPIAKELLARLGFDKDVSERVQYLIGHHHTYCWNHTFHVVVCKSKVVQKSQQYIGRISFSIS